MAVSKGHVGHYQRLLSSVYDEMNERKWLILSDFLISAAILYLVFVNQVGGGIGVVIVGIIQTLSVSELYEAYRRVQVKNRNEITEN